MPGLNAILHLRGPLADHPHREQPSPPMLTAEPSSATTPTRRTGHIDPGVIDRLIDRLSAQAPPALASEPDRELVHHLLRAPPLTQKLPNRVTEHHIDHQEPLTGPTRTLPGRPLRVMRAITAHPGPRYGISPG